MDGTTYYDLLQVSPTADPAVIDAAYRGLVARFQAEGSAPGAAGGLAALNEAYAVLSDPQRRAEYDRRLRGQAAVSVPPPASPPVRPPEQPGPAGQPLGRFVPPPGAGAAPIAAPAGTARGLAFWILALLGICALFVVGAACLAALLLTPLRSAVGTLLSPGTPGVVQVGSTPTAAATLTPTSPASTPTPLAFITKVVLATDTRGDNFEPVGVTNTFQPSSVFHAVVTIANAPDGSIVRAVWFADNVGNAAAPNTKIDEFTITTGGSRNLDFTLKPKQSWPAGTFHLDVYANGTLDQTLNFTVAGAASSSTPSSSNSFIQSTTFSRTVSDQVFEPTAPTTTFSPADQVIHFVVTIKNAPDNTAFKVSWYFGDQLIDSTTLNAAGTRNLDFNLKQNKPWPTGDYHVDLFVNGSLDRTVPFTVQ